MAKLDIINVPHPLLKTISDPFDRVDEAVRRLMDDMLETMYAAPGIGLAAVQVGIAKRALVMDVSDEDGARQPKFLINPEVIWSSPEWAVYNEGCLSVPEHYAEVERPAVVRVRYLDYQGVEQIEEMDGLAATCVQHEIDHLNGIVFIDHISKLRRDMIVKKLVKAQRDATVL